MKRVLMCILALIMILGIAGCGANSETEADNDAESSADVEANNELVLNTPVTAGNWEYTLVSIEFADSIGNYSEYENYLVPGGEMSGTNPFGLEEGETFAVVTYKLKMIGKETLRGWDEDLFCAVGTGKFIYGDGFVFKLSLTIIFLLPTLFNLLCFDFVKESIA